MGVYLFWSPLDHQFWHLCLYPMYSPCQVLSILAFSNVNLFASLSFMSFCPRILLAFSSASLLASFSLYCFAVILALFLSSFGLLPQIILLISISSSSGTFCLCVLTFVLGFLSSLRAKHLLVFAPSFI